MAIFVAMKNKALWVVFTIWLVVSLAGAALTQLYNDEAYYWVYSKFLDWGYFDHPPMIALIIKIGYSLIASELGVRLFSVFLVTAAAFLIYKIADVDNIKLFALILFSTFPFHLFGFLAVPDSPLIFFTTLFFFVYNRYLKQDSPSITVAFGLTMALMLYSKYHGILIILFTLLSNPILLKRKSFWTASILGALLFLPHLYWQYANSFPSVRYHLIDRSAKAYRFDFTLEYIGGQLLYYGPFMGFFLYWASFKVNTKDLLERALKFSVIGNLVFFLLSTLKGRVEVNWTIAMLPPMVILALRYYNANQKASVWLYRFAYISIPIIVLIRIHTIFPLAEFKSDRTADFRGHREFAKRVVDSAQNLPIAAHRYQTASSLSFYTHQNVPVLNLNQRFSQYDLWEFDTVLVNKRVAFVNPFLQNNVPLEGDYGITFIDSFPVFKFMDVAIKPGKEKPYQIEVAWNKPLSFYSFTKKHPAIISMQVVAGEDVKHSQQWQVNPESAIQIIPFDIPNELKQKGHKILVSLETPQLGTVREFVPYSLSSE